jgi:hypothetical protein
MQLQDPRALAEALAGFRARDVRPRHAGVTQQRSAACGARPAGPSPRLLHA